MDSKTRRLQEQVFSMEEILEIILKFVPGHYIRDVLPYRLVCKLWRQVIFKVLSPKYIESLPTVILSSSSLPRGTGPRFVSSRWPYTIPRPDAHFTDFQETISIDSCIPFSASLHVEEGTLSPYNGFFRDYSKNIVQLSLGAVDENNGEYLTALCAVEFPKLRRIKILPRADQLFLDKGYRFLHKFRRLNKGLSEIHMRLYLSGILSDPNEEEDGPEAEKTSFITNLEIDLYQMMKIGNTTSNCLKNEKKLRRLLNVNFPNMKEFKLSGVEDCKLIGQLVRKFSATLVTIHLSVPEYQSSDSKTISLDFMEKLESVYLTNLGIEMRSAPVSKLLPNLKNFSIQGRGTAPTLMTIGICEEPFLNIRFLSFFDCSNLQLHHNSLRCLMHLTVLHLRDLTSSFANIILSQVYLNLTSLQQLVLSIRKVESERCNQLPVDDDSVVQLLTRVKKKQIPRNLSSWRELLEEKSRCNINRLAKLKHLNLEVSQVKDQELSPFLLTVLSENQLLKEVAFIVKSRRKIDFKLIQAWEKKNQIRIGMFRV